MLGKYYSKNRKVQTRSKRSDIRIYIYISLSLSPRRDIVTRTKTCLSVSNVDISSLARFSRVLKILESSSDIPGKKKRTGTGYKLLNISQSYFFPIVEGNKRGLVDPRGCERVAGNHVSTKRLVSLLLLPLPLVDSIDRLKRRLGRGRGGLPHIHAYMRAYKHIKSRVLYTVT